MLPFQPRQVQFAGLCRQANTIPIYASLLSDQLTPISAFERIAAGAGHAFLLESVVGGEKIARYSFLSADPLVLVEAKDRCALVSGPTGRQTHDEADPPALLEATLKQYRTVDPPAMPRFLDGAVGYAGYDIARHYEKLGTPPSDDRALPDLQFGIYDKMSSSTMCASWSTSLHTPTSMPGPKPMPRTTTPADESRRSSPN